MLLRPLFAFCLAVAFAAPALALDLQAHRGGRGLRPENTLAAFENALRMGVTTLELDIAITADGVAVISHEPALYPGTARDADGRWLKEPGPLIRSLTLAEVQRYDVGRLNPDSAYGKPFATQQPVDGQRIPTLASLFALVEQLGANDVQFDIETKIFPNRPNDTVAPEVFVDTLLAAVRAAGMTKRVMIQSFDWRTLALVQRLEPGLRTVYLTIESRNSNNVQDPAWTARPDGARLRARWRTWSRPPAARSGRRTSTTSTRARRSARTTSACSSCPGRSTSRPTCAASSTGASTASSPTIPTGCAR